MADKRMFSMSVIDSDAFLDMPLSTQALYFHLSMRADDEGFINNAKKIAKSIGASDDELKVLLAKNFIIQFENNIIVIKHWWLHNYIRGDRIKNTNYQEEKSKLAIKDNKVYTVLDDTCQTLGSQMSDTCQHRIDKNRLEEISIDKNNILSSNVEEIISFLNNLVGTSYKHNTPKTVSQINARLKDGFTLQDFKTVITKKYQEWYNSEWQQYLRPDTLFGNKFEMYLNAPTKPLTLEQRIKISDTIKAELAKQGIEWEDIVNGEYEAKTLKYERLEIKGKWHYLFEYVPEDEILDAVVVE